LVPLQEVRGVSSWKLVTNINSTMSQDTRNACPVIGYDEKAPMFNKDCDIDMSCRFWAHVTFFVNETSYCPKTDHFKSGQYQSKKSVWRVCYILRYHAIKVYYNKTSITVITRENIYVRDYLNWIHDIQDKTPCIALTLFKHENGRVE